MLVLSPALWTVTPLTVPRSVAWAPVTIPLLGQSVPEPLVLCIGAAALLPGPGGVLPLLHAVCG